VGQLALYCNNPSEYERAMGELRDFDRELIELEKSVWGEDRYKLGSQVLTAWSFPENIARTLADVGANCSSNQSRALHLAYQLSNLMLIDKPDYVLVRTVLDSLGKLAGIADDAAENLFTESVREYGEIATILSFENPDKKSLAEIELEAKSRMIELTMQMHVQTAQVAEENSELKDLVFVDPLTKLGNRRQYDRIATAELNRCIRSKNPFGLMVIDIDHFKRVNDTYGHAVGDAILAGVARRLELSVRNYDFVFRFGGEEFVVILPESNSRICQGVAERLRLAMESKNFLVDEHDIHVTISIGVAAFDPGNGVDIETLFESADQALYAAKKNGRNQYLIASSFAATIPPIKLNAAAASTQANQLS
jgi:diguanylate cyclase (GGDEF)-like protein